MKKIIFIFLVITQTNILFSQTNSKAQTKPAVKPEIDKLAEKYKDMDVVTLFTSQGELNGEVEIKNNPDNKPQAVKISGQSENNDAVAEFLSEIIGQKIKQGYKHADGYNEPTDARWIKETMLSMEDGANFTLKKGNMYFICKGGFVMKYTVNNEYWFSIETGDNSRKGGAKATKFDF